MTHNKTSKNVKVANITIAPWKADAHTTAGRLASQSYQQGHFLVGNQPSESQCGSQLVGAEMRDD